MASKNDKEFLTAFAEEVRGVRQIDRVADALYKLVMFLAEGTDFVNEKLGGAEVKVTGVDTTESVKAVRGPDEPVVLGIGVGGSAHSPAGVKNEEQVKAEKQARKEGEEAEKAATKRREEAEKTDRGVVVNTESTPREGKPEEPVVNTGDLGAKIDEGGEKTDAKDVRTAEANRQGGQTPPRVVS